MFDDFYSALEKGRIEPITFWKNEVSKWTWEEQLQLEIRLIALCHKEEIEGRHGSDLHRYAQNLERYLSQQSNIQRQMEREQQAQYTDVDEPQLPTELATQDAMKIWDKAKKAGLINDDYSFNGTKYQMAVAAETMAAALGIKHKWKHFKKLWRWEHLAQSKYEIDQRIGVPDRVNEIRDIFSL